MKTMIYSAVAGTMAMLAAPAFAQDTAPSQGAAPTTAAPQTAAPAAGSGSVTDAEVTQFAKAVVAVDKIQRDTAVPAEQKQQQMAAKVQEHGLEPAKFNEIAQTAQADPALQTKVQAAIQAEAGASMGAGDPAMGASDPTMGATAPATGAPGQ